MSKEKLIYFDNNSHTLICTKAHEQLIKWSSYYNPSGDSKYSKESRDIINKTTEYIHNLCNTSENTHTILYTSGASESNSTIIRSILLSIKNISNIKPYIITSAIEHHNILQTLEEVTEQKLCEVKYIKPQINGQISSVDIENEIINIQNIGGHVILISIMYANNETGIINNISKIGSIAYKYKIPLHTDAVQAFGKFKINLPESYISALSMSFHKIYGPAGLGLLILENKLINEYKLNAIISGTQQKGLRGGTENVPAIASSLEALKWVFKDRESKNEKLYTHKKYIIDSLSKHYPFGNFKDYVNGKFKYPVELVIIGPDIIQKNYCIPNTIFISIAKNTGNPFCNILFKKALAKRNVIVSISSACLTTSPKASHVLTAMNAPVVIKKGVLRISLSDYTTMDECTRFINIFLEELDKFLLLIDKKNKK